MPFVRKDQRAETALRAVSIIPQVSPYAEGSAEISWGMTKVLCTASLEREVPKWFSPGQGGWITAEYGMLPRATHTRNRREAAELKQNGRTQEIQRLIGRALRQAVPLKALEGLTFKIDCDVLVADGGTRTASICGAWVALWFAIEHAKKHSLVSSDLKLNPITAVSLGVVEGTSLLDLNYEEDSQADFDLNLVFDGALDLIEIQGTAERMRISTSRLQELLALGTSGAQSLAKIQQAVLSQAA